VSTWREITLSTAAYTRPIMAILCPTQIKATLPVTALRWPGNMPIRLARFMERTVEQYSAR
jgi:hypothetical protein